MQRRRSFLQTWRTKGPWTLHCSSQQTYEAHHIGVHEAQTPDRSVFIFLATGQGLMQPANARNESVDSVGIWVDADGTAKTQEPIRTQLCIPLSCGEQEQMTDMENGNWTVVAINKDSDGASRCFAQCHCQEKMCRSLPLAFLRLALQSHAPGLPGFSTPLPPPP